MCVCVWVCVCVGVFVFVCVCVCATMVYCTQHVRASINMSIYRSSGLVTSSLLARQKYAKVVEGSLS